MITDNNYWTKDLPTEEGMYLIKEFSEHNDELYVVFVFMKDGEFYFEEYDEAEEEAIENVKDLYFWHKINIPPAKNIL